MKNLVLPKRYKFSSSTEGRSEYAMTCFSSTDKLDKYTDPISLGYKLSILEKSEVIDIIEYEVSGEKFCLDTVLKPIISEIELRHDLLNLKEGWGMNGKKISSVAFYSAAKFIIMYADYIFTFYKRILSVPEINPVRDGSIDIIWDTDEGYMAVNVKENKEDVLGTCYYYAKRDEKFKEGEINLIDIEASTALWMKYIAK